MAKSVDSNLPPWSSLSQHEWPTLLLGNGSSINLWDGFRYGSLFEKAQLSAEVTGLFTELDTTNFEAVLECVHHARLVMDALGSKAGSITKLYAEVRDALFGAVTSAHVDWNNFPAATHRHIAKTLDGHEAVFTTNYDLCIYWSHLENLRTVDLVDFFWAPGNTFDPMNTDPFSTRATRVYYPHGAIHLWQDGFSENGKWRSADGGKLLQPAGHYAASHSRIPLFVSEGTSEQKLRTIRRSPYLSFCLDALANDERNLVVFGHSLSQQDQHIVDAINQGAMRARRSGNRPRLVAVSIHPGATPESVIESKVRISQLLGAAEVMYFDSTTHPLGGPALHIASP